MTKTKENYVFPTSCITCTTSLMFGCHVLAFGMVVSFINNFWEPTHVTVRVFEVQNTIDGTMDNQVKILLDSFGLLDNVIIYIKNESSNLNTLTNVFLKYVVSCSPPQLSTPFVTPCNVKSISLCH
jgi:hypothetical protein